MSDKAYAKINLESQYNQLNIEAYQLMNQNDFASAKLIYKELIILAKIELKDDVLYLECMINFGITLFYCGKFMDSIDTFESAIRLINSLGNNTNTSTNTSSNTNTTNTLNYGFILNQGEILSVKAYANITLACLACGNIQEAQSYFSILLEMVENNSYNSSSNNNTNYSRKQIILSKIIYIFFRIDSLSEYHGRFVCPENFSEDLHIRTIEKVMYSLHNYLLRNELDTWIDTLKSEAEVFKSLKDFNGFIFSIFNMTVAGYIKQGQGQVQGISNTNNNNSQLNTNTNYTSNTNTNTNNTNTNTNNNNLALTKTLKNKIQALIKVMNESNPDNKINVDIDKLLNDMKNRFNAASEMYKKLYDLELKYSTFMDIKDIKDTSNSNSNNNADNGSNRLVNKLERSSIHSDMYNNNTNKNLNNLNNLNSNNNYCSKIVLIRLILKNTISNLKSVIENPTEESNKLHNIPQILKQTEFSLELLNNSNTSNNINSNTNNNTIDLSDIDLEQLDPTVFKSLKRLHTNLCLIKYRLTVLEYFKKFMYFTLGYSCRKALSEYKAKRTTKLYLKLFNLLREGSELIKFNFNSSGFKKHFYQLSLDDKCIKCYSKKGDSSISSRIRVNEILKFAYGVNTENLKKKSSNSSTFLIQYKANFLFSIKTISRTFDFYAEDEVQLNKWYYGMKYLFYETGNKNKISTTSTFVFSKLKMKLFNMMKEEFEKNISKNKSKNEDVEKDILINKIIKTINNQGINALSFIKIFLLFIKTNEINMHNSKNKNKKK